MLLVVVCMLLAIWVEGDGVGVELSGYVGKVLCVVFVCCDLWLLKCWWVHCCFL